jgi:hypothetical protein
LGIGDCPDNNSSGQNLPNNILNNGFKQKKDSIVESLLIMNSFSNNTMNILNKSIKFNDNLINSTNTDV